MMTAPAGDGRIFNFAGQVSHVGGMIDPHTDAQISCHARTIEFYRAHMEKYVESEVAS